MAGCPLDDYQVEFSKTGSTFFGKPMQDDLVYSFLLPAIVI
jgi:hypothetical protein